MKNKAARDKYFSDNKEWIYSLITRIANEHSNKKFGYLTNSDMKGEIWVICLERLEDFDFERGNLEHFLRCVVHNRLINRFKDMTKTVKLPCIKCPFYDKTNSTKIENKELRKNKSRYKNNKLGSVEKITSNDSLTTDCRQFGHDKHLCDKWNNYNIHVNSRNSLLNASEQQVERKVDFNTIDKLYSEEIVAFLAEKINKNFLLEFKELINGGKISKQKLKKLRKEIFRVFEAENMEIGENLELIVKVPIFDRGEKLVELTIKGKK